MDDYRFWASRVAFGLAALAMSTLTVGALVVLPERLETEEQADAVMEFSRRRSQTGESTLEE